MAFGHVLPREMAFEAVLPKFTEFYRVLLGFTGFYRVVPSCAGFRTATSANWSALSTWIAVRPAPPTVDGLSDLISFVSAVPSPLER